MILVTGAAGFIGYHLCTALLQRGEQVIGIDSINDYYDPQIKIDRLQRLSTNSAFSFHKIDICDYTALSNLFSSNAIDRIVHLAAQAGVRFSLTNPFAYQKANSEGFLNIIECARHNHVKNFVYASSSSVYGGNTKLPFSESDRVDNPVSLYAATKKANELVAHCYSHLFQLPTSGLRFFTVYGPWGRPDMALFLFTRAILEGKAIDVFNNGQMLRNFTYIDDIVTGIQIALDNPRPYEVYNIGNSRAENLMDFIAVIEQHTGKTAQKNYLPMQPGDVPATVADISKLAALGYEPHTNIDKGVSAFVQWYRDYYKV
jgi:UDP-glucuronate 4-epimerase